MKKFKRAAADCELCTAYKKGVGCTVKYCPHFAERVAAGALNYRQAISEAFRVIPAFEQGFPGVKKRLAESVWNGDGHRRRMDALRVYVGRDKRFFTNEYLAAMYLLTATKGLYDRTHQGFTRHGLEFGGIKTAGLSIDEYTLLGTAKTLYFGTEDLTAEDIAEAEIVSAKTLPLILNAVLIVRFGEAVLENFL